MGSVVRLAQVGTTLVEGESSDRTPVESAGVSSIEKIIRKCHLAMIFLQSNIFLTSTDRLVAHEVTLSSEFSYS